ncbi:hypothetical protein OXX59_007247 [Metschnikowia pulcherrima]
MSTDPNNSYIPKYIQDVPWYYKTAQKNTESVVKDSLAHHRKAPDQAPIDHSEPRAGLGISDEVVEVDGTKIRKSDDYEAKRDRWHGHSAAEWDHILSEWDRVKRITNTQKSGDESDDTDYELELQELGLARTDLKMGLIEDPLEKSIRDRRDVPEYIRAINGNVGGKIRLGKDSTTGITNDSSECIKESRDVTEFKKMQQFAWEKNKEFEAKQQKAQYDAKLASLQNPNVQMEEQQVADLGLSIEASPTLMMLKNRQNEQAKKEKGDEKRRKLMERYG